MAVMKHFLSLGKIYTFVNYNNWENVYFIDVYREFKSESNKWV